MILDIHWIPGYTAWRFQKLSLKYWKYLTFDRCWICRSIKTWTRIFQIVESRGGRWECRAGERQGRVDSIAAVNYCRKDGTRDNTDCTNRRYVNSTNFSSQALPVCGLIQGWRQGLWAFDVSGNSPIKFRKYHKFSVIWSCVSRQCIKWQKTYVIFEI